MTASSLRDVDVFDYQSTSLDVAPPSPEVGAIRNSCVVTIPVAVDAPGPYELRVSVGRVVFDKIAWEPAPVGMTNLNWQITGPGGGAAASADADFAIYWVGLPERALAKVDGWAIPPPVSDACGASGSMLLTLTGESDSVSPGDVLPFSGSGFWPDETVAVTFEDDAASPIQLVSDGDGHVSGTVTMPDGIEEGSHMLTVEGALSGLSVSTQFVVVARSSIPGDSDEPSATSAPTTTDPLIATTVPIDGGATEGEGLPVTAFVRVIRASGSVEIRYEKAKELPILDSAHTARALCARSRCP